MSSESVKVIVRARPMNGREISKQCTTIVQTDQPNCQLTLTNPNEADSQKVFSFDAVFPSDSEQQTVYEEAAFPLVESVLDGYNGTIFAYGQTGCGKSHTMMGAPEDENLKGVIPRAFDHIFGKIECTSQTNFLVRCSYIEIYNEEIHDLIGGDVKQKLELKESADKGVFIKDISMHIVKSVPEIQKLMLSGSKNRSVGETAMNKDSSRSHSLFTIYVETSEADAAGNQRITLGKLNLVDLAGSERQSKTGATGDRLKEANKINLSLSALGNVISALVDGKSSHIPYRDSKLTRLLQDSLGGNTKTVMIANVSPASDNYDETLGTLRYASRAKNIKNKPKVNEDPKDAMLREYAEEITRLKLMLGNGSVGSLQTANDSSSNQTTEKAPVQRSDSTVHKYEDQLKQKETQINDEIKKRQELENKLSELQNQFTGGNKKKEKDSKTEAPEEKKKYQDMMQKLKDQHQKQEELLKLQAQKEEEVVVAEKKYASLQEEVDEQRKVVKRLRKKYKDAMNEIKDLEKEHELNKEDLLDTIRLLERDVKINNAIMNYLLSPEELEKIRAKARWQDDRNEFVVPPFILRAKKVKFPKLNGVEVVHEEWNNRDIEFMNYRNDAKGDENDYASDADVEEDHPSTGSNKNFENSPPKHTGYGKDKYSSHPGSGDFGARGDSRNRNYASNLPRNYSKDGFDMNGKSFRDTVKGSAQNYSKFDSPQSLAPQKKTVNKNVQLDPINQNHLSNNAVKVGDSTTEKILKAGFVPSGNMNSMATLNTNLPPMKGKVQLQPLNHSGAANPKTMKLSFQATLLINNDGSNAELQNMSSHVKGY